VFSIAKNGAPVLSDTFGTLSAANTFFNDDAINLGRINTDTLTLDFTYELTTSDADNSYENLVIVGVPEPSEIALLGLALLAIPLWCHRRPLKPGGSSRSKSGWKVGEVPRASG